MRRRVPLGRNSMPGVNLRHVVTRGSVIRIIAGTPMASFKPSKNRFMKEGGTGGSKGTLEMRIDKGASTATIYREVPKRHQGKGIGTALLRAAERVARSYGCRYLIAATFNPAAQKTYHKCGWTYISGPAKASFFNEKSTVYMKKLYSTKVQP